MQSITGSSVLSGSGGSSGGVLDSGGHDDVEGELCGSTTATAGSSTSSYDGVSGVGASGGSRLQQGGSRKRKSRITYDREQGVRYYRGTATTDINDCDCEDI
ncbi:uncharacterized protein LOC135702538 [Ochlerotatus camptorhynchus]|uniref:uncharacterized protein LOC135702538 n=1 Tax=Ochlerotatus camptorhynchus TaxID=644619 RepID=UPI0031D93219